MPLRIHCCRVRVIELYELEENFYTSPEASLRSLHYWPTNRKMQDIYTAFPQSCSFKVENNKVEKNPPLQSFHSFPLTLERFPAVNPWKNTRLLKRRQGVGVGKTTFRGQISGEDFKDSMATACSLHLLTKAALARGVKWLCRDWCFCWSCPNSQLYLVGMLKMFPLG